MQDYISLTEAAEKWGISARRLRTLCDEGRVSGAGKLGRNWAIPINAEKPKDARVKSGKYIKTK